MRVGVYVPLDSNERRSAPDEDLFNSFSFEFRTLTFLGFGFLKMENYSLYVMMRWIGCLIG